MTTQRFPVSVRRFVRREKARIRRETSDRAEAEKRVTELILAMRKKRS